jgi:hypothetical protein
MVRTINPVNKKTVTLTIDLGHVNVNIFLSVFEKVVFCSTLSEFENFRLCERILINLTTCQNETSS